MDDESILNHYKNKNMVLVICNQIEATTEKEIQLLPFGQVNSKKGTFFVDDESLENMVKDFNAHVNDFVIDYEHQTMTGQTAPAAGWIKQLVNKGKDGLWGIVDWTQKAAEHIKNKEYKYLSPVVLIRKTDKKAMLLLSGALTNTPAIDGMQALANKFNFEENKNEEDPHMDEFIKKLLEIFGLPEGTTQEDLLTVIAEKATAAPAQVVANKSVLELLELKENATLDEVKGCVMALKNPDGYVKAEEFQALKATMAQKERDELVEMALKAGKVTPASKAWAEEYALKDPTGFKSFLDNAPVVVNMSEVVTGNETKKKAALDDMQISINKALGISDEDFEKYQQIGG